VEDVKDPIGRTGWPKEKGRDGERTPMQWDASNRQAGFSSNPKTWLPVPGNYTRLNVQAELQDPNSLLNWHKKLIALRRSVPAIHDGGIVMLDVNNPNVLSYLRTAPAGAAPVVVSLNMSGQPQTVSLDLASAGVNSNSVKTLLGTDASMSGASSAQSLKLPPYGAWIGSVGRR
jgi:alpha-glucosidase